MKNPLTRVIYASQLLFITFPMCEKNRLHKIIMCVKHGGILNPVVFYSPS
jgi:hypothetical protein